MKKKATIRDIANQSGVSTATVSRFINKTTFVDPETAEKIQSVITRLDYKPNMAAQSLKTKKSRSILLIVPDISNPFYSSMAKVVQGRAKKENFNITLFNTNEDESFELGEEIKAIRLAVQMNACGIIMASIDVKEKVVEALQKADIPTVVVNSYDACAYDSVHGKRNQSTYLATKHLIDYGHKRVAYTGGSKKSVIGRSRQNGYLRAMKEANYKVEENLIFETGFSVNAGYEAGRYFGGISPLPTAICCANDLVAMGVMASLRDAGIQIPDQISITGMDNIPYAVLSVPRLTTVTNDSQKFANAAIDMLFERIRDEYKGAPREIEVERELVVRESTRKI